MLVPGCCCCPSTDDVSWAMLFVVPQPGRWTTTRFNFQVRFQGYRRSREEFDQIVHYNYSHRVRIHKTNRIRGALVDTSQTPPHETGNNSCPNAINCSTEAVEASALSIVRETATTLSDQSHHRCTDRVDKEVPHSQQHCHQIELTETNSRHSNDTFTNKNG